MANNKQLSLLPNQCDGCMAGMPLTPSKFSEAVYHLDERGRIHMRCTAYKYSQEENNNEAPETR